MAKPDRIEGYAIVSSDGMLANAARIQPEELRVEADKKFFLSGLAKADVLAHGHNSYEDSTETRNKRRLLLTRQVSSLEADPSNARALRWNPANTTLDQAWAKFGLTGGTLAVLGGTDVFGLFLEHGYDVFYLSHAPNVRFPGGVPVFPGVPARSPDELLRSHGLVAGEPQTLDQKRGVTLVTWRLQKR